MNESESDLINLSENELINPSIDTWKYKTYNLKLTLFTLDVSASVGIYKDFQSNICFTELLLINI